MAELLGLPRVLWQIKDQYVRAVAELNQQNAQLQDELKTVRNDLRVANIQVDDLKKVLEELRSEMLLKVISCLLFGPVTRIYVICHRWKFTLFCHHYISLSRNKVTCSVEISYECKFFGTFVESSHVWRRYLYGGFDYYCSAFRCHCC